MTLASFHASFHGKCSLKLQEKLIDLFKSLALILPQNATKANKIKVLLINQHTLITPYFICNRYPSAYHDIIHFATIISACSSNANIIYSSILTNMS